MNLGIVILIIGALVNFGADLAYKKKKITDMETLLKIKLGGVAITIIGLLLAIYFY